MYKGGVSGLVQASPQARDNQERRRREQTSALHSSPLARKVCQVSLPTACTRGCVDVAEKYEGHIHTYMNVLYL